MNTLIATAVLAVILLPGIVLKPRRSGFFLAGKRARSGTVAGSLLATCLGASATVGVVARAYETGWAAFWWLGSGSAGLLLLGLFWAVPMRSRDATQTLPQWAGAGYGMPARVLAAVLIDIMWIGVIAAQWVAAGTILEALFGWPLVVGIAVPAACVTLYTAWGGQTSVLRTDLWQLGVLLIAILLPFFFLHELPTGGEVAWPPSSGPAWLGGVPVIQWAALVTVVGGMYVVGPDLCSRVLAARDDIGARLGALTAGIVLLPCSFIIVAVGVRLRESGVVLENAREALPWLITQADVMPEWAGYLAGCGLLAAMLSSADTCLLTAASVFELDLIGRRHTERKQVALGRVFVGAIGVLSAVLASIQPRIIPNLLLAYAFYSGGLLVPLLLLGFPKAAARVPVQCVWTAMAAGGLTPVLLLLGGRVQDSATAGLCGVLLCLVIILVGAAASSPARAN